MLGRIKSPYLFILSAIVLFDAYLRLWKLPHLFLWINDYDEGAYSMGGRFIAQGFIPYKDFTLVHPPLYDLVLATIYKVFGYNFYYGRYFSVILSIACLILIYFIVKKLYNPTAGIIASLLFVVFPGFYSAWYRAVQEPLGIFLILFALFFALDYIKSKKNGKFLLFSGFCLGLTVATKYTFIPAVAAFIISIAVISTEWNWRNMRTYFAGLLKRDFWLLISSTITGFFLVVGYFLIKTPKEFFDQTIFSQLGNRIGNVPSTFIGRMTKFPSGFSQLLAFSRGTFENTIETICIIICLALLLALMFKKRRSKPDIFFLIAALITLPMVSLFNPFGETRYFVSFFFYILLAIVTFIPALNINKSSEHITLHSFSTNIGAIVVCLLMIIFLGGTVVLRLDYNFLNTNNSTYEDQSYKETIDYLKNVGAKKVYALDPIIPALAPDLNSALEFDTFGAIMTMKEAPDTYYQTILDEGVDYIVMDPFLLLSLAKYGKPFTELALDIQKNGVLVKTTEPNGVPILGTQIYKVTRP